MTEQIVQAIKIGFTELIITIIVIWVLSEAFKFLRFWIVRGDEDDI